MEAIITDLVKYGQIGVIMALVILVGLVIFKLFEVLKSCQTILHEHLEKLTNAFECNSLIVKQNTEAIREFKEAIKDCKYNCR